MMQWGKDYYFKRCETYQHLGELSIDRMDMHFVLRK
jgi:hypothetical protein